MKKKIYFEPPKDTPLPEYLTIEYGKIRNVNILQLASEVPKKILELDPSLNKDSYLPLKNFHAPLKIKRIDKYIAKQKSLKYTHEVILPPESVLKGVLHGRKLFIKLNFIELLILDYFSFSWSNSSVTIRLTIIGIAIAIIIPILIFILNLISTSFFG